MHESSKLWVVEAGMPVLLELDCRWTHSRCDGALSGHEARLLAPSSAWAALALGGTAAGRAWALWQRLHARSPTQHLGYAVPVLSDLDCKCNPLHLLPAKLLANHLMATVPRRA